MSIFIAIPQAEVVEWMHKPYSEMVAAVEGGTLKDAKVLDREVWDAGPKKDGEIYGYGGPLGHRMKGYAIFRDGSADTRPDAACLYYQGY